MFNHLREAAPGTGEVGLAFTDRFGGASRGVFGELNLGRTDIDEVDAVAQNFDLVRQHIGVRRVITVNQVHGTDVLTVDGGLVGRWSERHHLGQRGSGVPLPVADALVTAEHGVALCIRVADCVPVLLADPEAGVIGAAHAGRVGLAAGVLVSTADRMRALGAMELEAWIGPHICGDCYEVPEQMRTEVSTLLPGAYATTSWQTPSLDLGAASERQLVDLGCRVNRWDPCTRTEPGLHSHRRDGALAGRLAGLVWIG